MVNNPINTTNINNIIITDYNSRADGPREQSST